MNKEDLLSAEKLRELLGYEPSTGAFTWKVKIASVTFPGKPAGNLHPLGYRRIRINGHYYFEHRLAWLHVHGHWPLKSIDHINLIRSDNRICNLRDVSLSENQQNTKARQKSSSGVKGVGWNKHVGKWQAQIKANGKNIYLGVFAEKHEASAAYLNAAALLHTHNRALA